MNPANLILPVFIHEGKGNVPIASMPGVDRLSWRQGLPDKVREARSYGVNSVVLFPKVLPTTRTLQYGTTEVLVQQLSARAA